MKDSKPLQIIQAYAPHSGRPDEEAEIFYDTLEKTVDRKKYCHNILMGDLNAKIGTKGHKKGSKGPKIYISRTAGCRNLVDP